MVVHEYLSTETLQDSCVLEMGQTQLIATQIKTFSQMQLSSPL